MTILRATINTQEVTKQGLDDATLILQNRYNQQYYQAHESVLIRQGRREASTNLKVVLGRVSTPPRDTS